MPHDLSQYLVIGISSRALFDLGSENEIFISEGVEAYSAYQIKHEGDILNPGSGFSLAKAVLNLNKVFGRRVAEVIVMSRNSADTSLRIFNSIEHHDLDLTRAVLTSGASLAPYLHAFDIDLFLSADEADVQAAINSGVAAGRIYDLTGEHHADNNQIRVAFDGDAVIFSYESERIYVEHGLEEFLKHEKLNARKPLPEGPFAKLLKSLSYLQHESKDQEPPIRTALITARNSPAHERVIRTLREWKVTIDEVFFLGGVSKDKVVKAFNPHIFFDDQDVHLAETARSVPVAKVPYVTQPAKPRTKIRRKTNVK